MPNVLCIFKYGHVFTEATTGGVLWKRVCSNIIKKETLAQAFSCEFSEIFKNIFFTEHIRVAASLFTT